jgi:hypothetical protein
MASFSLFLFHSTFASNNLLATLGGFLRQILFISILLTVQFVQSAYWGIQKDKALNPNKQGAFEICWLGSENSETLPLRLAIQDYLNFQITERAGLKLEFYSDCLMAQDPFRPIGIGFLDATDNSEGIQTTLKMITAQNLYPNHPTTYHQGVWANLELTDINLSAHLKNVSPQLIEQAALLSVQGLTNLKLSIALHEVLHAFGLKHENDRPDSLCHMEKSVLSNRPIGKSGPYDKDSIMNYCLTHSFDFELSPIPLSELDILALKSYYK